MNQFRRRGLTDAEAGALRRLCAEAGAAPVLAAVAASVAADCPDADGREYRDQIAHLARRLADRRRPTKRQGFFRRWPKVKPEAAP